VDYHQNLPEKITQAGMYGHFMDFEHLNESGVMVSILKEIPDQFQKPYPALS
jgi:hypothetical protein